MSGYGPNPALSASLSASPDVTCFVHDQFEAFGLAIRSLEFGAERIGLDEGGSSQMKRVWAEQRGLGLITSPPPWPTGLYNGSVHIYNHETGTLIKTFEVAEVPVRPVRFILRKNWFVAGSDDFQLRVFNYNTHEKAVAFKAHPDYIRCSPSIRR
ncbi:hypothetical protein DFH11DRAFT_1731423 [Phellopilus nigrolimitatus]|nr:hypothetical protein DFH11DRAFT_1731423 [Phellopilus nigrolimitatus]